MSEDSEPSQADAPVDVKAKMAQLSGNRIKKQRGARAAAARASNAARTQQPKEVSRAAEIIAELPAAPTTPTPEAASPSAAKPATPKAAPRPAQQATKKERAIGPAPVFLGGFVAGLAPAIVLIVMSSMGTTHPDAVPAEAQQRARDWIHCPDAIGDGRWRCEVFTTDGQALLSGEFALAAGHTDAKGDWKSSAQWIVPDGWVDSPLAKSRTLFVRGIRVETKRGSR